MASCYICGKEHVTYRRRVPTGTSYRSGYSSRGRRSYSTTDSYGLRTVCAQCALNIDYRAQKNKGHGVEFATAIICICIFLMIFGIMSFTVGLCTCAGSVIIGIMLQSNAKRNAETWYAKNAADYVDAVDVQQRASVAMAEAVAEQKRRAIDETRTQINAIHKTFSERIATEVSGLEAKVALMAKPLENLVLHSVDECDKTLDVLKVDNEEIDKFKKGASALFDDYEKQIKGLITDKTALASYLTEVEKARASYVDMINKVVTQLKDGENQVLRVKLQMMTEDNANKSNYKNANIEKLLPDSNQ